jgi:hypothetical protein
VRRAATAAGAQTSTGYWPVLKRVHMRMSERVNSCDLGRIGTSRARASGGG